MVSTIQSIVQIVFSLVVGAVAVLTCRQAKRTLLQPMRTEVFKEQLRELAAVLTILAGKSEADLRRDWANDEALHANTCLMFEPRARALIDEIRGYFRPDGLSVTG